MNIYICRAIWAAQN